jgi:molybdopterin converting factor small subunit
VNKTIKLAPLLRKSTDGQEFVQVDASTTLECLGELGSQFPDVRRWLYDKQGDLRPEVIFFVNGERVFSESLGEPLQDSDEIYLMLAIAGG